MVAGGRSSDAGRHHLNVIEVAVVGCPPSSLRSFFFLSCGRGGQEVKPCSSRRLSFSPSPVFNAIPLCFRKTLRRPYLQNTPQASFERPPDSLNNSWRPRRAHERHEEVQTRGAGEYHELAAAMRVPLTQSASQPACSQSVSAHSWRRTTSPLCTHSTCPRRFVRQRIASRC